MRDPNSGYADICGAPYLEDDEGNCCCNRCLKRRRDEDRTDYLIEREIMRQEARRDEKREWAGQIYNWNER